MDSCKDDTPTLRLSSLDAAPVHMIRVNSDGRVSEVSSAAGAVLSRPGLQARVVGELFVDTWVAEEDRVRVRAELSEALQGNSLTSRVVKAVFSLPSGSWKTVLSMAASRSDAGSVDGVVILVQDFDTLLSFFSSSCHALSSDSHNSGLSAHDDVERENQEVRRLREQVQQAHQDAAELEAELKRTRQEMWRALHVSSSNPLESPSAKVKEHVINELRSPLAGIIGLANTLSTDDTALQKPLKMISSNASRALDNVIDLIDFFYLVEGPLDSALARRCPEGNAHEMIIIADEVLERCSNALNKFGEPIRKRDVQLTKEIQPLETKFSWDHRCVMQMLYHLIINALKFTTKGHVKLRIADDLHTNGINIVVEDTGIGIASRNISRVFEPFQQEDNSPARKYDGLGLGLAIVHSVVIKYCGTVKLDSKQGQGTKLSVWLPVVPRKSSLSRISISSSMPDDAAGPDPRSVASAGYADVASDILTDM